MAQDEATADETTDETTDDMTERASEGPVERPEDASARPAKAPGRKTPPSKGSSKRSAPKKAPAKKSPPRKAAATAEPPRRPRAGAIAREAAAQLHELIGHEIEGVTGVRREDDGWLVEVDLVELRRVPATTDVIATYEVELDEAGDMMGYRRLHRFVRGSVGEGR